MIEYTIADVLRLEGISYPNGKSVRIQCPFCGGQKIHKNFGIDLNSEVFNCFNCGISGRGATNFYAYLHECSTKEAYAQINVALGISPVADKNMKMPPRKASAPMAEVIESAEADLETRNNTYSNMLQCLSLLPKHLEDLLSRGFTEDEVRTLGYKSYPKKNKDGITKEYFDIPKRLYEKKCTFKGVPGFYKTKSKGYWTLCGRSGGILVPYKSFDNKIEGFQLRKDNEDLIVYEDGSKENKYSWISSGNLNEGCRASTKVHYACDFRWNGESFEPILKSGSILLTEGAMKADLAHAISGYPVIAIPGVTSATDALRENIQKMNGIGLKKIYIAYDMDRIMNINVLKGLEKIKSLIEAESVEVEELFWSNRIVDFQKKHFNIDPSTSFIFSPETITSKDNTDIHNILADCISLGRKKIFFAFRNSEDVKKNYSEYQRLCKIIEKSDIQEKVTPCFWSLKLKGIDDFYAHKSRGVQYI